MHMLKNLKKKILEFLQETIVLTETINEIKRQLEKEVHLRDFTKTFEVSDKEKEGIICKHENIVKTLRHKNSSGKVTQLIALKRSYDHIGEWVSNQADSEL